MNKNKETFLNLQMNRFQFIANADNAVETKAIALSGFSVAVTIAFLAEVILEIAEPVKKLEGYLGMLLLSISVLISFWFVLKKRAYGSGVVLKSKINTRLILPEDDFFDKCIIDMQKSLDINSQILKEKNKAFRFVVIFFIVGIIFLVLSVVPSICF